MRRTIISILAVLAANAPASANFLSSAILWEWCQRGISLGFNMGAHDGYEFGQVMNGNAALCTAGMTAKEFDALVCQYLAQYPQVRGERPAMEVVIAASVMTGPSCSN